MKTLATTTAKFFIGIALLVSGLSAGEEHVPVGTRALSHSEHVNIQEQRELLSEENIPSQADKDLIAKKTYYTSHEGAFHRPIAVTYTGDRVTLEDGTVWQVRIKDRSKTLDWLIGDSLIILPNHSWFSSYHYVLLNQNTGKEVKVNMLLGPIYNGVHTHWVVAIDYYNKEVCLEDGSVWRISSSILNKWLVNDTVVIGVNDAWFSSNPNILINVNMLNYVTAVCEN